MTISTTFPSDNLVPGVSHAHDLTSGSRGLVPSSRAVLFLGAKKAGGTATADVPVQVYTEADADAAFGAGSMLALMLRAGMRAARERGAAPAFWGAGITPPGGGTAASNGTFVFAGTATAAGDIEFAIAGRRMIASVAAGATATVAAAALVAAVNAALAELPGTLAAATGTATYTHGATGVDGNGVVLKVYRLPAGLTCAVTQPSNGAGVLTYTTALTNSLNRDFNALAIQSTTSTEIAALLTHMGEAWAATKKRWRFAFVGCRGSVATCTTLAAAANDHRILIVAQPDANAHPAILAAAAAAHTESVGKPNQNFNDDAIAAIPPVDEADEVIESEIQSLMVGGCTPIARTASGRSRIVSVLTTRITDASGNPSLVALFYDAPKTLAYVTRQVDAAAAQTMRGRNVDAVLVRDVRSAVYDVLKRCEDPALGYVHNVDAHAAEIVAEPDPVNVRRINVAYPTAPIPIANQIHGIARLFVEAPAT
jgi:phage tail sheath gpL-like